MKSEGIVDFFLLRVFGKPDCSLVVVLCSKSGLLFSVEMLVMGQFEVDMWFVHLGGGWIGGLDRAGFAPGFRFVLLLVLLEVGGEGDVHLPHLNSIHNSITNNNIKSKLNLTALRPGPLPLLGNSTAQVGGALWWKDNMWRRWGEGEGWEGQEEEICGLSVF